MAAEELTCNAETLAEYLGVSPTLVRRQARAGLIPHVYLGDRLLFIPSQVHEYLADKAAQSVRPPQKHQESAPVRRRRRIVQPVSGAIGGDAS